MGRWGQGRTRRGWAAGTRVQVAVLGSALLTPASLNFQTPTRSHRWLSSNGNHSRYWNTSGVALENAWSFNGHIGLHNHRDQRQQPAHGDPGDVGEPVAPERGAHLDVVAEPERRRVLERARRLRRPLRAVHAPGDASTTFSYRQLRTDAVLRREYRPGSTLFLVWARGRQGSTVNEPWHAWHDDFANLFSMHPENTFLVKVSYWLNR